MTDLSEVRAAILTAFELSFNPDEKVTAGDLHALFEGSGEQPVWPIEVVREACHQLVWTDQLDITSEGYLSVAPPSYPKLYRSTYL